jgi:tRNA G26 N,N-dimethylase Trm1
MTKFQWTPELEVKVLALKKRGLTFAQIAAEIGTTERSAKHKVRRLRQAMNQDRYKHTDEKLKQIQIAGLTPCRRILETHAGFGGLTRHYAQVAATVTSIEIKQERIDEIKALSLPNVELIKGDSEVEIYRLLHERRVFDVIDVDPYGLPSRYFPHIFGLIDDGILFLTFPVMGVAQINKMTIAHYRVFWGIELSDKDVYLDKIKARLAEYAFMHKRQIEILDEKRINRIYRLAIQVKKTSLLDMLGLKVNRNKKIVTKQYEEMDMFD